MQVGGDLHVDPPVGAPDVPHRIQHPDGQHVLHPLGHRDGQDELDVDPLTVVVEPAVHLVGPNGGGRQQTGDP